MRYFKSIVTGRIITEDEVKVVNDIYGGDHVSYLIRAGVLEEVTGE